MTYFGSICHSAVWSNLLLCIRIKNYDKTTTKMFRYRYLTRTNKSEDNFFEILQRNTKVSLRSGVNDSDGVTDHKSFESVDLANNFVDKTVKGKLRIGFKESSAVVLSDTAVSAAKPSKNKRKFVEKEQNISVSDSSSEVKLGQIQKVVGSNSTLVLSKCESLKNELKQMEVKKTQWLVWTDKFSYDCQNSSSVSLNIGGKIIILRRDLIEDLHASNGNFFSLISGRCDKLLARDRNGHIFLDLDSKWVEPLVNLARDMTMWDGVDENTRPGLCCDPLDAFGLRIIQPQTQKPTLFDSNTLSEIDVDLRQDMSDWLGWSGELNSKLLFRGSRDGFKAQTFHTKCDGHKDTICIIRDTYGNVFGGYADIPWNTGGIWSKSSKCFLFSLKKDGVVRNPPVKFNIKQGHEGNAAVCSDSSCMCVFGSGHDLYIANDCNLNTESSSTLGGSYERTPLNSLSSQRYFKVSEIEVFEVVQSDDSTILGKSTLAKNSCTHSREVSATSPIVGSLVTAYGDYFRDTLTAIDSEMNQLRELEASLRQGQLELLSGAIAVRDELKYVATFVDLYVERSSDVSRDVETLEHVQTEIETYIQAMITRANSKNTSDDATIIYINVADGNMFAVSKATLLQAPSGSILANMASDVWGHDLDNEGNIIQDVNPELFRLIIAHLRLKTLLQRVDNASAVPQISVYEEQKAAMTNLLAFYAMSEVPLKVLKRGGY